MPVVIKIAVRNLLLHKAKTLIVGFLITLGISLTLVGNTLLSAGINNLEKSFTNNFTGDVLITTKKDNASIFGTEDGGGMKPPELPILKDYEKVFPMVVNRPEVDSYSNQLSVYALLNLEDRGFDFSLIFGIEPENYLKVFNGVQILQGRMLNPGEKGLVIHEKLVQKLKKDFALDVKIGDTLNLNNFGQAGAKIQVPKIIGIYRFNAGNDRLFLPMLSDAQTARSLVGKSSAEDEKVETKPEDKALLVSTSEDDLFGSDMVTKTTSSNMSEDKLNNVLGPKTQKIVGPDDGKGTWNFLILRLKKGSDPKAFIDSFNAELGKINKTVADRNSIIEEKNKTLALKDKLPLEKLPIEAWAQGWLESSVPDSSIFSVVAGIFNLAMFIMAIVTIIIVMNTLMVSIMERTSEIGMMRALGGQKSFVRTLFITETLILTVVSGVVGIIIGFLLTWILSFFSIPMTTDFLKIIAGGDTLKAVVDFSQIGNAISFIITVGLFSWVIPVLTAQKVSPLKAITTE